MGFFLSLCLCRTSQCEPYVKKCAFAGFGVYRKFGLVCFTKLLGDVQAKAGPFFPGGVERFENLVQLVLADAGTIIGNSDDAEPGFFVSR